jgi:glycosyltransferase involved in cell wall biosynthesis
LLREADERGFAHELCYLERPLGGNAGCYTASDFTWQFSVPVHPAGRSQAVCYENFGLSYREALRCERPGLASNVGGLPEGLPPELAARVIARHDEPGHLARLTADLIDQPALARRVAERGAEYVRKDLSSQRHGRLTLQFYREMLARAGR